MGIVATALAVVFVKRVQRPRKAAEAMERVGPLL